MRRVLGALGLALGLALAVAAPAGAVTTGNESFNVNIVISDAGGVRTVVNSVVIAKGVFRDNGTIVEVDNLPGDPENALRDDLVFASGRIHLLSLGLSGTMALNSHSCGFQGTAQQVGQIVGGTGRFAAATGTFTGTVVFKGTLARTADGCSFDAPSRHEIDKIDAVGTMSF